MKTIFNNQINQANKKKFAIIAFKQKKKYFYGSSDYCCQF